MSVAAKLPRDLEMFRAGCAAPEILLCNIKWLLLSSRLQASCCPRSWSLRSKMRLPQCCENRATQGEEENLQSAAQFLWHVQGHLFCCYCITAMFQCISFFLCCTQQGCNLLYSITQSLHAKYKVYIYWFWAWFLYWSKHEHFTSESIYI